MNFDDYLYQQFMTRILHNLEPRQEPHESIIFGTNVETNEIFFVNEGAIDIGFELNSSIKMCLRLQKGGVVGAFNCTFNKKTIFIYRVHSMFTGYTIRKLNWLKIIMDEEYEEIAEVIRNNFKEEYHLKIKNKVLLE